MQTAPAQGIRCKYMFIQLTLLCCLLEWWLWSVSWLEFPFCQTIFLGCQVISDICSELMTAVIDTVLTHSGRFLTGWRGSHAACLWLKNNMLNLLLLNVCYLLISCVKPGFLKKQEIFLNQEHWENSYW